MAKVLSDLIDFSAYEQETNVSVKVRRASQFIDDLDARYEAKHSERKPEMFSTKLRGVMEFRPGEVTVWAGYNGHKKSMFVGQMALDMCVQQQRTMIASFEMEPASTLDRMMRQATAVEKPAQPTRHGFAHWTDDKLWLFDHIGRIDPKTCIAVCRYFAEELRGKQVVIDSMMMVVASEEKMDEQKQFMTDIVRLAQETGLHVHLVAHCRKPAAGGEEKPPTKYELRGSAALSDQAHNVITVWANKAKKAKLEANPHDPCQNDADALVTVEKQRNGSYEGRIKLWFDEGCFRFKDDQSMAEPYRLNHFREAA